MSELSLLLSFEEVSDMSIIWNIFFDSQHMSDA